MFRRFRLTLTAVMAALATGCIAAPTASPPAAVPSARSRDRSVEQSRATNCPAPTVTRQGPELPGIWLFSQTLMLLDRSYPEPLGPRAAQLLVGALKGVAVYDGEVQVDHDPGSSPRWVTVSAKGRLCTLNIERVDSIWALRSVLRQALQFIDVDATPTEATPAARAQRMTTVEIAATNGLLSTLDGRSWLLDAETYRQLRGRLLMDSNTEATESRPGKPPPIPKEGPGTAVVSPRALGAAVTYLRISRFAPGASGEVERALAAADTKGGPPKAFILDLRDNPGGSIDEAIKVADAFVASGTLGSTVGKLGKRTVWTATPGHEPTGALLVLVSRRTASASEVVAAAVKNLGRGIVLGETTAGVASIQVVVDVTKTRVRPPAPRPPNDRDVVQDIIDGKEVPPPAPSPLPEVIETETLGLLMTIGRVLASGGGEIERTGVRPDLQSPPSWPVTPPARADEDCLLQLAHSVIGVAKTADRSTLLSTAESLVGQMRCPPAPARSI